MATALQLGWLKAMVVPAQLSQRKYGVPASITLAQCILESGWGQSQLARRCSNFFGIKAFGDQPYQEFTTREVASGRSVDELTRFARYPSAIESFDAHARLLATSPRYAPAMKHADNPSAFATAIRVCGYSTNPNYTIDLLELIHEHDLEQYDVPPPDRPAVQTQEAA